MPKKLQPAVRSLLYTMPVGGRAYIDLAKDLSATNRRGYDQGRQYGVESIEFMFTADPAVTDTIFCQVHTAGNSWFVHNAHTKGEALWNEMNDLVLHDNPSIKGKWHDYKVYLDGDMASGTYPILDPQQFGGAGSAYQMGEWEYSKYVMPQHEVDPVTGDPLAALEYFAHLVGDDTGVASGDSQGLVKAYAESRSTVFFDNPNVPAGLPTSFFNLLTDSGSQEPELAAVIIDDNDDPPYHDANYPQGDANAIGPVCQDLTVASTPHPNGHIGPFVAECGLIMINMIGSLAGASAPIPTGLAVRVNLMPGSYKGVASLPMGQ